MATIFRDPLIQRRWQDKSARFRALNPPPNLLLTTLKSQDQFFGGAGQPPEVRQWYRQPQRTRQRQHDPPNLLLTTLAPAADRPFSNFHWQRITRKTQRRSDFAVNLLLTLLSSLPSEVAVADFPCLFFVHNLIDGSAVSLTSNVSNTKPLTNLQHTSKRKAWQGAGTSATVTIDLGAAQVVDSLLLTHENFSPTATIEWRYSSDNFASENVSAGSLTLGEKPSGFDLVFPLLLETTVTRRYWRLILTDGSNADGYLQVGRLYIGRRTGFTAGIIHPLKFAAVDSSKVSRNAAGDPLRHARAKYRRVSFAVSPFTDAVEAHKDFWDLCMQVGLSTDFFLSLSPQATSEAVQRRHTLYGAFSQIEGLSEESRGLFIPQQVVFDES